MKQDLMKKAKDCIACKELEPQQGKGRPNQHTPDLSQLEPLDHINVDLFSLFGKNFLIIVDKESSYIKVYCLKGQTTREVTDCLEDYSLAYSTP